MLDIKVIDKKSRYYGQTLKGYIFYYDIKHTGDSDNVYIAISHEGENIQFLSSQIDESYYNKQELAQVIEKLGANIGDTVLILKGGSGSYKKDWEQEGPHIITDIDFTGHITFDNGNAIIFRPKVKVIKE